MKKLGALLTLCSSATLLLIACSSAGSDPNPAANPMHMSNADFLQSLMIKKGESVTLIADTFNKQFQD